MMIPCPECGKKISEDAESCPKCGYKLTPEAVEEIKKKQKKKQKQNRRLAILIAIFFLCLFAYLSDNSSEKQNPKYPEAKYFYMLADDVLKVCGKPVSTKVVGRDSKGLLVEWRYPDVTFVMGRRYDSEDGITAYRVIKILPPKVTQKKIARAERIKKQFSASDGSHLGLTKYIKKSMCNPSSCKHADTIYSDEGDYLLVFARFHCKKASGAMVTKWIEAKVDLDGNVIEIVAQGENDWDELDYLFYGH